MKFLTQRALRTGITFVLSFGIAKATSFAAALALPRLVDARLYGLIELALTIGLLAASILGVGAPAVAMRSYLVEKDARARSILIGHCLWLATVAILAAGAFGFFRLGTGFICSAAIIALFGLQLSASTYTRMHGHIHFSGWCDNVTMMAMFLLVVFYVLRDDTNFGNFAISVFVVALLIGAGSIALFLRTPLRDVVAMIPQVLEIGAPMMFFGVSTLLIFGTARIAIANRLSLADVGTFSLCARISLVMVFTSQVLTTGLFRSVYRLEHAAIARIFSLWTIVLSGIAFALTLIAHFGAHLLVAGTNIPAASLALIFPAVATQTTLWVLNSNLEMFITRELVARQAATYCLVIAAIGLGVGLILSAAGLLSLMVIINVYSIAMLALLLAQMRLLSRQGISFRLAYPVLPLVAACWLVYLLPSPA
jgi:O-antigen/teichoic acid export membrane protein